MIFVCARPKIEKIVHQRTKFNKIDSETGSAKLVARKRGFEKEFEGSFGGNFPSAKMTIVFCLNLLSKRLVKDQTVQYTVAKGKVF